jgi:CBS domain-containing protein
MKSIKQVLDAKGRAVWSVAPGDSVFQAMQLMADKEVGALLVLDDGKPRGLVSERDYARKIILMGRSSRDTTVEQIMEPRFLCVRPSQTVEEGMALMTEKRVRHLPVLEDDKVEGIVSIGDLVKAVIEDQQFIIEQLENFISG